jgi:uncharacterized protein
VSRAALGHPWPPRHFPHPVGQPLRGRQAFNATHVAAACANFAQVRTAILFGSRAKGNYRNGSDVDIALEIDGDGYDMCLALADYLNEETLMPYHFDMIDLAAVDNAELLDQFIDVRPKRSAHLRL